MELLKQPQYTPYPVERQVAAIYAATKGHLDRVPLDKVHQYERDLLDYLDRRTEVLATIAQTNDLTPETEQALKEAVEAFTREFLLTIGVLAAPEEAQEGEAEVEQEQIKLKKRG
jgi:F-type H+-transporting ATPase subunit alpha